MKRSIAGLTLSLLLMAGSLSAGTRALLVPDGKGGVDVVPVKGELPVELVGLTGTGGGGEGLLGIPDTFTYSTNPQYIYAGIDPQDTLAVWFQCAAACSLYAVGFYVYLNTVTSADMYAVVAPLAPGVDVEAPTADGRGDYVDYHLGIDQPGPSPWDLANKYADAFTTVTATGITWLTLPSPVDVGTNIFVAGYTPLTTGTDGAGEPWMVISAGDQTNNYGWHSLVYQQDLTSFGVSPGWYNNWHAHTIYAAVEYYENIPPTIDVVDLSDTYDRDGPFVVTATIVDLGVPADSGGVDPATVMLYYSTDGGVTFQSVPMTLVSGDSTDGVWEGVLDFTGSPLAPGTDVIYYVEATDIQGAMAQSAQASFTIGEKVGEVLWILGDNVDNGILAFYEALNQVLGSAGKSADVWQTAFSGLPDASVIVGDPQWSQPYEAIVITSFAARELALDSALFAQYLDNGGNLLVISQDLFAGGFGYGPYDAPITLSPGQFAYDYLGIGEAFDDYVGTDPAQGGLTANNDTTIRFLGDASSPVTGGLAGGVFVYDNNLWMPYVFSDAGMGEDFFYDNPAQDVIGILNDAATFRTYYSGAPIHYFVTNIVDTAGGGPDGVPEAFDYDTTSMKIFLAGFLAPDVVQEAGLAEDVLSPVLGVSRREGKPTVTYVLPVGGEVELALFDALGRKVRVLMKGRQEAGIHSVSLDGETLPRGIYVLRLEVGDRQAVRRVLILP